MNRVEKILKAVKYRIYPNDNQKQMFENHFGCTRYIYNYGLGRKIEEYQNDKNNISCFDLMKEVIQLKREKEWLKDVSAQSLNCALMKLECAFKMFFRKNNLFPKFKNKRSKNSFQCPQDVKISDNTISIPKIKNIKATIHRGYNGKVKTVTITKTSTNKYYASAIIETNCVIPKKKKVKKSIGIDLGIKSFATLSNGKKVDNPKYLKQSMERLKVLHRRLSKKRKGSNNRNKARLKVALQYEKVSNQRLDFLHKLSTKIVSENQAIAIEDLNVKGMIKNHSLAQSISDCSWSMFVNMIEYKSEWNGCTTKKIGRFQPSSKMCSCGEINKDLKLSDRKWSCKKCGATHDRDVLASNNILKFSGLGQSVEPVELPTFVGAKKQEPIIQGVHRNT